MTALQNIIKEAKILRAKYPKKYSKWTDYVKAASKNYAAKNTTKKVIVKKKVIKKSIAKKPTEKVILKKVHSAKQSSKNLYNELNKLNTAQKKHMIGALPIGFRGAILGVNFKVINQFDIYNNVSCIIENTKNGDQITIIDGSDLKTKQQQFINYISYYNKDELPLQKQVITAIDKFLSNLNSEVKKYNAGNKATTKKKPIIIKKTAKKTVVKVPSNKNTITKIKEALREDKKRLTGGYKITSGNVRIGSTKNNVIDKLKIEINRLKVIENELQQLQKMKIDPKFKEMKGTLILEERIVKNVIQEQKQHIKELKKII